MEEPTLRQHKKLEEIKKEGGSTGRHGNEDDIDMLYELVSKGYVKNLVSLGPCDWIFRLTPETYEYLEKINP